MHLLWRAPRDADVIQHFCNLESLEIHQADLMVEYHTILLIADSNMQAEKNVELLKEQAKYPA